jgi:hypothetical protein
MENKQTDNGIISNNKEVKFTETLACKLAGISYGAEPNLRPILLINDDYTLTINDCNILVDSSEMATIIVLPANPVINGTEYHIKKIDSSLNNILIRTQAESLIDGKSEHALTLPNESVSLKAHENKWYIF